MSAYTGAPGGVMPMATQGFGLPPESLQHSLSMQPSTGSHSRRYANTL